MKAAIALRIAFVLLPAMLLLLLLRNGGRAGNQGRENPFAGMISTPSTGTAFLVMKRLEQTQPATAALLKKIADHAAAYWLGDWIKDVDQAVQKHIAKQAETPGALPIFVVYNLPNRDCGNYSAGGAASAEAYRQWISAIAAGIGGSRSIVILEPDALGLLTKCNSEAQQAERLELLRFAVHSLKALGDTTVYIDAGIPSNPASAREMAIRLRAAGIQEADGFALNISNFFSTEANVRFGHQLSGLVGRKHFVIDTSRNGRGPLAGCEVPSDTETCWCNPPGRGLGAPPTTQTADPLVDAFLWIKVPGNSDGNCNGGPKAGSFWLRQALELATNSAF